jgi:c-di-GMP-binding flagellar brake protein YcgR
MRDGWSDETRAGLAAFRRACEDYGPVEVALDSEGDSEYHRSRIIRFPDDPAQPIRLIVPAAADGTLRFGAGDTILVSVCLEGDFTFAFQSRVQSRFTEPLLSGVSQVVAEITYPGKIYRIQRRRDVRVRLVEVPQVLVRPATDEGAAVAALKGAPGLSGAVEDISCGGALLRFSDPPQGHQLLVETGAEVIVSFQPNELGEALTLDAKVVRRSLQTKPRAVLRAGVEWIGLDRASQRALSGYVTAAERALLRRMRERAGGP